MTCIVAARSLRHASGDLGTAVRTVANPGLRRAGGLTRLALLAALDTLVPERCCLPTALLWQTTSGPRAETQAFLAAMRDGDGEPLPYDFLATQPALAAVQLRPWLPGLCHASHAPLTVDGPTQWSFLLAEALTWLERYPGGQALCAHLDVWEDAAEAHCLLVAADPAPAALARIVLATAVSGADIVLADTPDLPERLPAALAHARCRLAPPTGTRLALEFVRL